MRKAPCNFHHLQKATRLETFVEGEEEDRFSFRHHRERCPHMLALDQMLQLPIVIQIKSLEVSELHRQYAYFVKLSIKLLISPNNTSMQLKKIPLSKLISYSTLFGIYTVLKHYP